jgi:hypothetical protein
VIEGCRQPPTGTKLFSIVQPQGDIGVPYINRHQHGSLFSSYANFE